MLSAWIDIVVRIWRGFFEDDGFIFAGYLAYLSLLALFPFLLLLISVAAAFGESDEGVRAVGAFLQALPPNVASVLRGPIEQVVAGRVNFSAGSLLTLGIGIAIWTAASFIETVRVILHRAYDHSSGRAIWQNRLQSFAIVIGSALLVLIGMSASLALAAAKRLLLEHLPGAHGAIEAIAVLRFAVTPVILFGALYGLFAALSPRKSIRWPGALLTVLVWLAAAEGLPRAIAVYGSYDVTYGSLAGLMVTLLFFYLVGLGFVLGAQLNAAMKSSQSARVKMVQFED
jgi:membrane protein